ncbi:MAG: YqaJ viral recombinase family protein [Patescibacteria group bacterium]|nr:YqaJ viral recombinase family protein [Patescibacteria group bacterium]
MKIIDVQQGSPEWLRLRLGIPTASEFSKIVTPTGKLSKQSVKYANQLIAEELMGEPIKDLNNLYWIERGKMLEPDAVQLYEFETGNKTIPVGFVTNDAGTIGASPDRFTNNGICLEIKCVAPDNHVRNMVNGFDEKYKPQVQGQLYVTELEHAEWFSYHPDFPPVLRKIDRDDAYIKLLHEALTQFVEMKAEMLEKIKKMSFYEDRQKGIELSRMLGA